MKQRVWAPSLRLCAESEPNSAPSSEPAGPPNGAGTFACAAGALAARERAQATHKGNTCLLSSMTPPAKAPFQKEINGKENEEVRYDAGEGPFTFSEFLVYYGELDEATRRWRAASTERALVVSKSSSKKHIQDLKRDFETDENHGQTGLSANKAEHAAESIVQKKLGRTMIGPERQRIKESQEAGLVEKATKLNPETKPRTQSVSTHGSKPIGMKSQEVKSTRLANTRATGDSKEMPSRSTAKLPSAPLAKVCANAAREPYQDSSISDSSVSVVKAPGSIVLGSDTEPKVETIQDTVASPEPRSCYTDDCELNVRKVESNACCTDAASPSIDVARRGNDHDQESEELRYDAGDGPFTFAEFLGYYKDHDEAIGRWRMATGEPTAQATAKPVEGTLVGSKLGSKKLGQDFKSQARAKQTFHSTDNSDRIIESGLHATPAMPSARPEAQRTGVYEGGAVVKVKKPTGKPHMHEKAASSSGNQSIGVKFEETGSSDLAHSTTSIDTKHGLCDEGKAAPASCNEAVALGSDIKRNVETTRTSDVLLEPQSSDTHGTRLDAAIAPNSLGSNALFEADVVGIAAAASSARSTQPPTVVGRWRTAGGASTTRSAEGALLVGNRGRKKHIQDSKQDGEAGSNDGHTSQYVSSSDHVVGQSIAARPNALSEQQREGVTKPKANTKLGKQAEPFSGGKSKEGAGPSKIADATGGVDCKPAPPRSNAKLPSAPLGTANDGPATELCNEINVLPVKPDPDLNVVTAHCCDASPEAMSSDTADIELSSSSAPSSVDSNALLEAEGIDISTSSSSARSTAVQSPSTVETELPCPAADEGETTQDEDCDMFLNVCRICGETAVLIADLGDDFVCELAGKQCANVDECGALDGRRTSKSPDAPVDGENSQSFGQGFLDIRTRLLYRAAMEKLSAFEVVELLRSHGLDPVLRHGELTAAVAAARAHHGQHPLAGARSRQQVERQRERYIDSKAVQLKNGDKYVVEAKESKEQKAATSVSIRILGNHTGASSTKEKKKGPRS